MSKETRDIREWSFSLVSITDAHVRKAAEHAGVTEERVRAYLKTKDDQDESLFQAFAFLGVFPTGKFPRGRLIDEREEAGDEEPGNPWFHNEDDR